MISQTVISIFFNLFRVHDDTLPVACGALKHRTAKVRDVIT